MWGAYCRSSSSASRMAEEDARGGDPLPKSGRCACLTDSFLRTIVLYVLGAYSWNPRNSLLLFLEMIVVDNRTQMVVDSLPRVGSPKARYFHPILPRLRI